MIKNIKFMLAAAALMVTAASCQEDPEDAFSLNPTAPVLAETNSVLMTKNTMTESVTWAWTATRFAEGSVNYQLYATYNDKELTVGSSTTALTQTVSKTEFKGIVDQFGAPSNSSFTIKMFVRATDAAGSYDSDPITVTIFSYGDAVAAVVTPAFESVELNMETPEEAIALLSWEPARLGYNEDITYSITASYEGGAEVEVASKLTETSYSTTIDALNELVVATGAPEESAANVDFIVYASSVTIEALPSSKTTLNVKTYKATYPAKLYLPGSHQGWNPATAPTISQSTLTKGLFEAFVDLTAEGENVEFKFAPVPEWKDDFGSDDFSYELKGEGDNAFAVGKGSTLGSGNIKVPSGLYRVSCDMKHKTVELVQIKTVGIIGSAVSTGWGEEIKMTYDAAQRTYSVATTLTQDQEYKFRINDNWDYSIGDNGAFDGGANYKMDKETGEYNVILNVASHPYSVRVLSTNFPVQLYLPGSYQGWNPAAAPTLQGNGEGIYEGGVLLGSDGETQFKFSPKPAWDGDFGCDNLVAADNGVYTGTCGAGDNLKVVAGFYYITYNMVTNDVKLEPIKTIGIIGGFAENGWGSDVAKLEFNAEANVWTGTYDIAAGVEWKLRANDAWDWNRGGAVTVGTPSVVVNGGDNIKLSEDGKYTITLDLSVNPNTVTVTK